MPTVAHLTLHPIKSLDGQAVAAAEILPSGALAHDRAYAIVDAGGVFVNAKRHPAIHRLRSQVDVAAGTISLRDESDRGLGRAAFELRDRAPLHAWLGAFFGFAVTLEEDRDMGFPDDLDSPGPTVVSTATLEEIAHWFELAVEDVRARLRSNVEVDGVPAFWEDRLFGPPGVTVGFAIGAQAFCGVNPCQRCAVPTRDPWTGRIDKSFTKRFIERRRATLPAWAQRERFDHFYKAAVNTRLATGTVPKTIRVGDAVVLDDAACRVAG